jgi:hypothetical protein
MIAERISLADISIHLEPGQQGQAEGAKQRVGDEPHRTPLKSNCGENPPKAHLRKN